MQPGQLRGKLRGHGGGGGTAEGNAGGRKLMRGNGFRKTAEGKQPKGALKGNGGEKELRQKN